MAAGLIALGGCGANGLGLARVPEGSWGGDNVALTVAASSATVEFDCAHARIEQPLSLDGDGRFGVPGTFVREHGGPVHEGEPEDAHPAVFEGQTDGHTLTLNVRLSDVDQRIGPFVAVRGAVARLVKCV